MLDHALNVPLRFLSNAEIEEIANGGVQEDGNIEFKSALDEGSDADRSSWADGGRLARSAKADLIKAVISFANAYGGTLYLGVKESDDDPKRSCGLSLIPRISELEAALCDAMRDTIEPRLPSFESRSYVIEGDAGVLAIRVAASPLGPHWNAHERQCYQRIGSSSQRIGMREIQSITLDRAQTSMHVDVILAERRSEFERVLLRLAKRPDQITKPPVNDRIFPNAGIAMRCTGVPLAPVRVDRLTEREDLRIGTTQVRVTSAGDQSQESGISCYENIDPRQFQPALRGWSYVFEPPGAEVYNSMLVRWDGAIERVFCDMMTRTEQPGRGMRGVQFNNLFAFVLSTATSVEVFRSRTGTQEVPYELEFDLIANPERGLNTPDSEFRAESYTFEARRTIFPRFLLGHRESIKVIGDYLQADILNSANQSARRFYQFDTAASFRLHERL